MKNVNITSAPIRCLILTILPTVFSTEVTAQLVEMKSAENGAIQIIEYKHEFVEPIKITIQYEFENSSNYKISYDKYSGMTLLLNENRLDIPKSFSKYADLVDLYSIRFSKNVGTGCNDFIFELKELDDAGAPKLATLAVCGSQEVIFYLDGERK